VHSDDSTIDLTLRPRALLVHASDADPCPEPSQRFARALVIGVPLALLMWAGIGFAIFRTIVQA